MTGHEAPLLRGFCVSDVLRAFQMKQDDDEDEETEGARAAHGEAIHRSPSSVPIPTSRWEATWRRRGRSTDGRGA